MIGLALIDQSIAAIEAEIKQKKEEKQALIAIGQELNPFLTKVKDLCLHIPNHKNDILALIAAELNLSVAKSRSQKKTQSLKKLPFQVGDRVTNGDIEFEIKDIRSRGIGWQIFDKDGNAYPSSAVEKIPLKKTATEDNSKRKVKEKSTTTQTQEEPQEESAVTADVDPKQKDIFTEAGFKLGDCVWHPQRGGQGKVIGFEDHGIAAKVLVNWEYGNNESYWPDSLKLKESSSTGEENSQKKAAGEENSQEKAAVAEENSQKDSQEESVAATEEATQKNSVEASDTQSQKTPSEDSDLISQAIEKLNSADWKPSWIDYQKGSPSLDDDATECILMIADGNRRKGFIIVKDNSFYIGTELSENTYLKNIESTLSEVAPVWEKKPETKIQDGINLGQGIKKDFEALTHDNLMANRLYVNNFSKAEWQGFAILAGIEKPVGTRKQIANAICEVYQKAYNESKKSSPVVSDKNDNAEEADTQSQEEQTEEADTQQSL